MGKVQDLTGKRFGRLTVMGFDGFTKNRQSLWKCRCDCGGVVSTQGNDLRRGHTKSCGCLHREMVRNMNRSHSESKTRLYRIWKAMRKRCFCQGDYSYANYGGRGITVCAEWAESFEPFRDWALANGYRDDLTIDRINVNGDYCPENCRWANGKTQARNRRNNAIMTAHGKTQTMAAWCEELGLSYSIVSQRKHKLNWSDEKALFWKGETNDS